jgi:hypothetical protein
VNALLQTYTDAFIAATLQVKDGKVQVQMKSQEVGYFDMFKTYMLEVLQ